MSSIRLRLALGVAYGFMSAVSASSVRAADAAVAAEFSSGAASSTTIEAVTVSGNAKKSQVDRVVTAGILGSQTVLTTPFSVSAVTSQEILQLQTKDINGAFRNDASFNEVNSSLAQASGASAKIRGVSADQLNTYKVDGLAVPYWSIDFPIEQFDQIQLFKGATGFMYGFGSPAGIINFVSRRPPKQQTFAADFGYRSDSLFSGHVDAGGRFDDDKLGYRINLQGEDGEVYNGGHNANYSGALALDARVSDRLTIDFDAFYMKTSQTDEVNTVEVGPAVTHLATVPGATNFGAFGDWKTNEYKHFTVGLDYRLSPTWTVTLDYRTVWLDENFPGNNTIITSNAGAYTSYAFFVQREFDYNQFRAVLNGDFATGPLTHHIVLGAEDETQRFLLDANSLVSYPFYSGNIYVNPQPKLAGEPGVYPGHPTSLYHPDLFLNNDYSQGSFFAADTIDWNKWSLIVGGRYTIYSDVTRASPTAPDYTFRAWPLSPTVALTYKILPQTRLYASYVEALQNGGQAPSGTTNFGETFAPIKSQQWETGLKTDQRFWSGTLDFFHTQQDADYTTPNLLYVQSGQVVYQGVELNGQVRPVSSLSVAASVTYLNATLEDETPAYTGKQYPGAPNWTAVGRVVWGVPEIRGFGLNADVRYTSKGYGNTTDSLEFPAYATGNVGASYATTIDHQRIVFRFTVRNVADQRYWVYNASTAIPGEPRTFVVGIHAGF